MIRAKVIGYLVALLMRNLTPELLKQVADKVLDVVEDAVKDSANKLDDRVVLPVCYLIRKTFDVPDADDVE